MQLTCPCCSGRFSLEAVLSDEAARRAVAAALKLPAPLGDLVVRYVALFRPVGRALSWSRTARLLGELAADIARGSITRRGRLWAAPMEVWRQALEEMLTQAGKLTLPLKSHGYLQEIIVGIADKAEGQQEAAVEERRRKGQRASGPAPAARTVRDILGDLRHFKGLLEAGPDNAQVRATVRQLEAELAAARGEG